MRCDACGVELIPGKAFCHACGARTPAQCRKCGAQIDPAFRFCPDCGTPTSADVSVPPPAPRPVDPLTRLLAQRGGTVVANPSQIEGERKQVTVLFCDLVGSTSIADRLDPEEYHDLLEDYLEAVFPEIYRREGVVNQLAGDGLMALFGAPVAHEDAPFRAVRAALAMREALGPLAGRLRAKHGIDLTLRIGINTGPVVVGPVGNDRKMDYSAIGDTTNMASRLQSLAPVGGILISEATHRLVRGFFDVEQVGPLEVRGKTDPVTAYLVTDWRGDATRLGVAEERGLTPFVGREAELDRLVDAFRRLGDGQAQVVAVVGDAGSGKSRLLYELKARLADDSVAFFEGSGTSMLQALPYHLFVMMLGRYFGLEWDEDVEASCERVAKKFGASYEDIEREYPVLCRFLSLPLESLADQPADELRRQTFDAVARLVLRESEARPVVMLVEDLHWADEPSRELLQDLVRRLAGSPVLIVLTHRPDTVPHWTAPVAFSQIALRPLSDESTRAVVRAVAGPLPRDVERVLVQKAGGSPFFAEELVRGLIEEGHLSPAPGGGHRLTRPLADVPIPGTIQEVIAARLDALSPPAKRVVQVAAVLGRQFSRRQLTQLLADEGIDVERELHDLERRGLVHRKAVLSNDDLRFGESLTQEVAYEGLLLKQRRLLHERIGELLERDLERSPEHAALLAHHYSRSDNHTKAIDALLQAAREAEEAPSYRVAADLYRRAWRLAETVLGEREDGRFHRAALTAVGGLCRLTVFFGAVDLSEAEEAAVRGLELAALLGDQASLAQLHYAHGVITIMRPNAPDFAGGLALAERGLAIAEEAGLAQERSRIARGLALNYAIDGRFERAQGLIDAELAGLERGRDGARVSDLYLSSRWVRDLVRYVSDDLDWVTTHGSETFTMCAEHGNRTIRTAIGTLLAPAHFLRAEYDEARRWADVTLETAEAIANVNAFTTSSSLAVLTRVLLGEQVDVAPYVDRIEQGLRAGGLMQLNTRFVAEALLAIGDLERADNLTEKLVRAPGGRLRQALVLSARGDVLARLGRHDRAVERYAEAMAIAETVGSRSTLAAALLGRAEVAAARGEVPRDLERLGAIIDGLRLLHYRPRLERLLAQTGMGEPSRG